MSKNQLLSVRFGVAFGAMAWSIATPVLAQETNAAASARDDQGISDIIVTAQFRNQSVQEAPLAITAVDASLMEARSQTSVESVAQRAPSVTFSAGGQGGGAQTAAVNIRGIGATDFQFPNEPGVGIYIDDVYYGISSGAAFDLVDLDRIEILRGPQGTLSGKNSIGGSIKLFSRRPDDDSDAYVEALYGSFNRVGLRGATNITLAQDKLYARISGLARHVDGFFKRLDYGCVTGVAAPGGTFASPADDCVIGTEGGQNIYAVRGALRWIASDRIENNLIADFTQDSSEASPGKALFLPPVDGRNYLTAPNSYTSYANYTGLPGTANQYTNKGQSNLRSWGVSNTLDITLSDMFSLKSITAYRYAKGASSWDADNSPEDISNNASGFLHEQFTQELRLSADFGDMLEVTTGVYYYKGDSNQSGRIQVGVAGLDFFYDDPFEQTSKSAFLHGVLHATDQLNITGGIRYTDEDKSYTFRRMSPIPGLPTDPRVASLDGLVGEFAGKRWDYRVAVDYEVAPDVRFYAQVATGFKGGGVNPRPYLAQQLVPFEQETSTSYEAGFKSMWLDRKLRLNGAYYHNSYKNYQGLTSSCPDISPPGFPFCSATRNIGDAKIDGLELEFDARPVPGLSIDGSVSYTDFRFTSAALGSGIIPGTTEAPFVSKWKYAAGVQYEVELGKHGSLTPRLDYTWQSKFETTIPNSIPNFEFGRVESRGLLNARLTYRTPDDAWEAALAATNLTDEFYFVNKYDRFAQSGNAYGQPGRPREIIFSVKRKF